MTEPQAFAGDYTDIRFIKGRKVCAITIEIPIEAGAAFVAAFGTPNPASGVPVAMARIDVAAKPEKKLGGKLAQRAGILCNEGAFQKFVSSRMNTLVEMTPEVAASYLRGWCNNIQSRADLDHNEEAARKFRDLELEYNAWKWADI